MLNEPIVVKLRFLRGVPHFDALVRGESPHPAAQTNLSETTDSRLSYSENPESLSHLGLIWYWVVTRQTDRIPIANTRSQQYLPVQLSRVKINKTNEVDLMRQRVQKFLSTSKAVIATAIVSLSCDLFLDFYNMFHCLLSNLLTGNTV